ncbi:MAG TPA: NrsF family protein [Dyella sp.]|uniref:NrsF family protein n=1 Tax=Dyella sp. TaxID=1869338 RepID=UPI002D77FAE2|nr:NrsF family protein [Dyella sp.]HET6554016.1 NrsF family protein [Dyella sp.]
MSEPRLHESLIQSLGVQLTPVRRLLPPWLRTMGWLLAVAAIAAVLLWHYGAAHMLSRWAAEPDIALAGAGAVITAICAAWVAFALGVPGHSARWAWLPVPGLLLWIGASGLGCLRDIVVPGAQVADVHQAVDCLTFILSFSVPLSALLVWLLRRACPLRPVLAAMMIGLASAAASAALLEICHGFAVAATDLFTHAAAVGMVILINALMGGRLLQPALK